VLGGEASWDDVDGALDRQANFLARFTAQHAPQTNEVGRAWGLLPGLLSIRVERVELVELGASAGLLLALDGYSYRYRVGGWGGGSPVLAGDDRGGPPAESLARPLDIVRRRGIDLDPVDVTTEHGQRLLECFVWPDQHERMARLREAVETVRADPPELLRGDYVELLPSLLHERSEDVLTVVMDSVSTVFLDDERYGELERALADAGREAPLAWLSLEGPRHAAPADSTPLLELTVWPRGERRTLARVDYHGAWLEWL
jgi:hypothetical protein